jgi:hypothetical protein
MARTPRSKPTATWPIETLMTPGQASAFLGIHSSTLRAWRRAKTGPAYVRHSGRCIRYRLADLIDYHPVGEAA